MRIAGDIIIYAGVAFIFFGVVGILRFKNFFTRILIAAKIDTVGSITILLGLAVKHGLSFFSLKIFLLMFLIMIINPLATHMIARSAYLSGYKIKDKNDSGDYSEDHV